MTRNFGAVLRRLRRQASLTQEQLGERVDRSRSTINKWETGQSVPDAAMVESIAAALDLAPAAADKLRQAAGISLESVPLQLPLHLVDERLRQILGMILDLRQTNPEQAAFVETSILFLLEGAQGLVAPQIDVPAHLVPRRVSLGPLERAVEGVLAQSALTPAQFDLLLRVARSEAWESKRLIAHALPDLLVRDTEQARPILEVLREDPPHPFWRTDIRRRAVEALPALYERDPSAALALLQPRPDDEVYTTMAALEVLADAERPDDTARQQRRDTIRRLHDQLLAPWPADGEGAALRYYVTLLDQCRTDPAAALEAMRQHQDGFRLERICIARALALTLPHRPAESLALLRHFLRRGERRRPVEHQNVRRAVVRTVSLALAAETLPIADAADVLELLAIDEDVHTRRGLVDALPHLLRQDPAAAMNLVNRVLLHDEDAYIQERVWRVLLERGELAVLETAPGAGYREV